MTPSFYSKSFQASIEDTFKRLQDFPEPPKDADKESLALYAKIHKSIAKSMSDIVDYFNDIAPYRNQDEISDTEMSDTHNRQIDKEGSEDGVEEDKEGEQEQDDGQTRDGDGDEEEIESRADGEEAEPVQTKGTYISSFILALFM